MAIRQVVVLSVLATIASVLIGCFGPGQASAGRLPVAWMGAQAFLLTIPGLFFAFLLGWRSSRQAWLVGSLLVMAVPFLMLLDAITFHWIGDRFLSSAIWRVVTELRTSLVTHLTVNIAMATGLGLLGCSIGIALIFWASERAVGRWNRSDSLPGPGIAYLGCLLLAVIAAMPALSDWKQTRRMMVNDSTRHPFCVFRLVRFRETGPTIDGAETSGVTKSLEAAVTVREHQQRQLALDLSGVDSSKLPDVLIVVIESFRRELVEPHAMPNLWEYADKGIHCRTHFSGGNATNHGMFSLLNGLEAIWYERPVRYTPLLNRLFHQAGYELGFFAGHNDWRQFYMDGYLSDEHFDEFMISKPEGLKSDRRATELASMFLDRKDKPSQPHRPRLALLYLYATHATYNSYAEDQVFQPAADDRFLYPYPADNQKAVWNRYKNSARTIDRFLSAVMRDDRVVVVTGDHGESFLDDDTIGHGIRISEFQNMTPAVVYAAGAAPRAVIAPTSHADLLPTLLSAVGLRLNSQATLDGVDLITAAEQSLADRRFVTRNYLQEDVGLIGPWTIHPDMPFAYRANVSLQAMQILPWDAIDSQGNPMESTGFEIGPAWKEWSRTRFGILASPMAR